MSHGVPWPAELIERYRVLYAENLSHDAIAKRLGVTRNASIGMANRLRKKYPDAYPKRSGNDNPDAKKREQKPRYKPPRTIARVTPPKLRATETVELSAAASSPSPLNIRLVDLKPHHCRWPMSDGRSCGHNKREGHQSYCATHALMAVR